MKIHSDFRDYYDAVRAYGSDPMLHYNRKEQWPGLADIKTALPRELINKVRLTRNLPDAADVERLIVGFCGTFYPCIRLIHHDGSRDHIYAADKLDSFFKLSIPKWGRASEHWERSHRKDQRERARFLETRPQLDALFIEVNAPLFVIEYDPDHHEINIRLNAKLKDYEFAKVKDPFTAFQEISMYLGNQLVKHDNPDEIADKYRIAMHGYDEHSFRHPIRLSQLR